MGLTATLAFGQAGAGLSDYVTAQEALAADDFAKAIAAVKAFAGKAPVAVKPLAQKAAEATDIKALRAAFKPLSEEVVKGELPAGHVVAFCPMYNKGAHWIQKDGKVANPYYGKAMLTCGEIQKKK